MSDSKYKEWIKPGIYNGLQRVSVPLFGVLSTMLLAHKALSKPEMGVWALFLVVTSFIEIFRGGIVKNSLIKYLNYSKTEDQSFVLSAAFFLNALVTLLLGIILIFFSGQIASFVNAPTLEPMLYIFTATLLLLIPFSHFEWFMYGKSLFPGLFWTYFLRQGSTLLGIVAYYIIYGAISLQALVLLYSGGILLGALSGYFFVKPYVRLRFSLTKQWLSKLWNFGKYVFGANVGALVFRNADQFLLSGITANTALVASQNIAIRILNIADIPSQVIADILFPKSANPVLSSNPGRIKYFYEKAVGASMCFVLPFVLFAIVFPKAIIFVIAGEQYYDAIPYLRLIAVAAIFLSFLKQWGVIMDSTGKPQLNFMVLATLAVLQIVFCYFFIGSYGLAGAAYALVTTHFIGFIITQLILNKLFKINFINSFKYAIGFIPEMYQLVSEKVSFTSKSST